MEYRQIGRSDIKVSEISLGCWTMGGLNWVEGRANGWANVDEDEITAAVKQAVDAGVNHFDNADVYGNGRAERMLARVFQRLGLASEDFIVATKMGHFKGTAAHAYEPAHIRHQCEQSLINLRRDYIDIYYFHHGDFGEGYALLDDAVATMNALVEEGKVRVKGQSAYASKHFEQIVPKLQPDVLQSWAHALDTKFIRPGTIVAELLRKHGMSFVAFSPLAQARLLGKFDPSRPPQFEPGDHRAGNAAFTAEALTELAPKIEALRARFGTSVEDLAGVALRYILGFPRVACVIPGFRNEAQVLANLAGVTRTLSDADRTFIAELMQD